MKLIIAEKPVLARNIVEALEEKGFKSEKFNAFTYKCEHFFITSLRGHILEYKEPYLVKSEWKEWSVDTLPIYSTSWGKRVKKDCAPLFENVKALLERSDVETVINAGDMDAEGQLLVDEVLEFLKCKKPVLRLNTANTTKEALLNALSSMKDNKEYSTLKKSAEARSMADMVYGFSASRAKTLETGVKTNIGRVASVVVYSVANRDKEIENFHPKKFITIYADVYVNDKNKKATCRLVLPENDKMLDDNGYLTNDENIKSLISLIENKILQGSVSEKTVRVKPPLPFDLLSLQKALLPYGLKSSEVLSITQSLRDNYSSITYNRTEHRCLPIEYFNSKHKDIPIILNNLKNENIAFKEEKDYKSSCFVNDEKLKEHFGIIPQAVNVDISKMTEKERLVYTLIAKRYLEQFMGEDEKKVKTLTIPLENDRKLYCTMSEITTARFSLLEDKKKNNDSEEKEENEENTYIPFDKGDYDFNVSNIITKKGETKPPKKFTSASLLSLLKKKGLGTPATRDGIVLNQYKAGYIKDDGKYIVSTDSGKEYIKNVPQSLCSESLTDEWKIIQEGIESGKAEPIDLMNSVLTTLSPIIERAKERIKNNVFFTTEKNFGKREGEKIKVLYRGEGSLFSHLDKSTAYRLLDKGEINNATLFSKKSGKTFIGSVKVNDWKEGDNKKYLSPNIEITFTHRAENER